MQDHTYEPCLHARLFKYINFFGLAVTAPQPILDNTTCPFDHLVSAIGLTYVNVSFTGPTGFSQCGQNLIPVCNTSFTNMPVAQSPFSVNCTIQDALSGMLADSSCPVFKVILDSVLPIVRCPNNVTVNPNTGSSAVSYQVFNVNATASYGIPVLNCGNYNAMLASPGYPFAYGYTTVVCTATALSGNVGSCNFTVFNVDYIPPVSYHLSLKFHPFFDISHLGHNLPIRINKLHIFRNTDELFDSDRISNLLTNGN